MHIRASAFQNFFLEYTPNPLLKEREEWRERGMEGKMGLEGKAASWFLGGWTPLDGAVTSLFFSLIRRSELAILIKNTNKYFS